MIHSLIHHLRTHIHNNSLVALFKFVLTVFDLYIWLNVLYISFLLRTSSHILLLNITTTLSLCYLFCYLFDTKSSALDFFLKCISQMYHESDKKWDVFAVSVLAIRLPDWLRFNAVLNNVSVISRSQYSYSLFHRLSNTC